MKRSFILFQLFLEIQMRNAFGDLLWPEEDRIVYESILFAVAYSAQCSREFLVRWNAFQSDRPLIVLHVFEIPSKDPNAHASSEILPNDGNTYSIHLLMQPVWCPAFNCIAFYVHWNHRKDRWWIVRVWKHHLSNRLLPSASPSYVSYGKMRTRFEYKKKIASTNQKRTELVAAHSSQP